MGQSDDEILKRLKAKKIKANVYLNIHDEKVNYQHDITREDALPLGLELKNKVQPMWMSKESKLTFVHRFL